MGHVALAGGRPAVPTMPDEIMRSAGGNLSNVLTAVSLGARLPPCRARLRPRSFGAAPIRRAVRAPSQARIAGPGSPKCATGPRRSNPWRWMTAAQEGLNLNFSWFNRGSHSGPKLPCFPVELVLRVRWTSPSQPTFDGALDAIPLAMFQDDLLPIAKSHGSWLRSAVPRSHQ